jgi:hypothetical protein
MSDPYSPNTLLLLHMNGSNGSTTFTDSSAIPKTVTAYGNAQLSTAQSKFGGSSGYFGGDESRILCGPLAFSGDYTIEFWVYPLDAARYHFIFDSDNYAGFMLALNPNGGANTLGIGLHNNSWPLVWNIGTALPANQWGFVHIARSGTQTTLVINGVSIETKTDSTSYTSTPRLRVGSHEASGYSFYGYLDDIRLTVGIARPAAVPTEAFPDPDPSTGLILPSGDRHDLYDSGAYRITGTVDELGVAGSYRVRLFDRYSGRLMRETWSDANGAYSFSSIAYRNQGYFVVAYDHGGSPLNAAIADLVTPELIS